MPQLLYITDMHVYADPAATLKGVNTRQSLAKVLQEAQQRFLHPDALILGGDLAQDGSDAAYAYISTLLDPSVPTLAVAGNHDAPSCLEVYFNNTRPLDMDDWCIIPLNTHHAGHESGLLGDKQLSDLAKVLASAADRHVLIVLHHPPVPVGSHWLDAIALTDADGFWEIITCFENVQGILCGHIHQMLDCAHHGVRVLGSPASCIQFHPQRQAFELDNQSPGYRWLNLMADGTIITGVERITGFIPADLTDNVHY
ncbi:MAG: metallophosphoesterase [Mariprofundaceae bacterium]